MSSVREMSPALVSAFAKSIFAKVHLLNSGDLDRRQRSRVLEAVSVDIRKYTDLVAHEASQAALTKAEELGVDLTVAGWHDQPKFDPGRQTFVLEHVVPVKAVRARCLAASSEAEVADALRSVHVAWILREEDRRLTSLGHRSNRPDPRAAYLEAGIILAGFTDESARAE